MLKFILYRNNKNIVNKRNLGSISFFHRINNKTRPCFDFQTYQHFHLERKKKRSSSENREVVKNLSIQRSRLQDAADKEFQQQGDEQMKITWLGLWSNVGLSLVKGVVGVQSGSWSLIADAVHSASDLVGDVVALAALNIARRPPDSTHPYGYGHFESLATLGVSAMLLGGGIGIGYQSFEQLFLVSENIGVLSHRAIPVALMVAGVSVLVKEYLYRITVDVGQRTRSPVLVANAWHHRTDAFSSILAFIGIGGAAFGLNYLDPIAGLFVSGMILKAGGEIGLSAIGDLTDKSRESDWDVVRGVYFIARELANEPGTGIIDAHHVRVRRLGHYLLLDFHLRVDPRLSVTAGYWEKNRIKRKIHQKFKDVHEIFVQIQAHPTQNRFTSADVDLSKDIPFIIGEEENKQTNNVQLPLVKTARSHFEIERDVESAIEELIKIEPVILSLSHTLVHYDIIPGTSKPNINVEVNLRMDTSITLTRAEEAAIKVREYILENIHDVEFVDIHLELLDD